MAYDKIIDSAKLDGALTAEANAIRAKTGGTANIPWNESTGFASAIEAIVSGSKVATGQFIPIDYTGVFIKDLPITITGLDFKPTRVIVYLIGRYTANGATYSGISNTSGLVVRDSAGYYLANYEEYDEDEDYSYWYLGDPMDSVRPSIVMNSDGFTVKATSVGTYQELQWIPLAYRYIAIG